MDRTTSRIANSFRVIAGAVAISMLLSASAFAADAVKKHKHHMRKSAAKAERTMGTPPMATEQQRLDALTGQVNNLQVQANDTSSEVKKIEAQIAVAQPAANTKPATIGEHVGLLETDFGNLKTDLEQNLGIHVHGLVDATYEFNFNQPNTSASRGGSNPFGTGGSENQLRVFDPDGNSFNLTQGNIEISRVKEGGVGFLVDLNTGTVANVLANSTRYTNVGNSPLGVVPGSQGTNWIDATQYYLTYTAPFGNGINLQAGRMVTLLGEEVIPVYNNQNYNETRSFMFGFAIPFTVTGIRAQYQWCDWLSTTLGVVNGWDDVSDNNDGKTLEGQIALSNFNMEGSWAFSLSGIWGAEQNSRDSSKRWDLDPILTWKPSFLKNVTLVDEFNYGHETGPVSAFPATTSYGNVMSGYLPGPNGSVTINHAVHWLGNAGYFVYDYSDALELATRGEWFSDPDGARTGLHQMLGEITQTISYKILASLVC